MRWVFFIVIITVSLSINCNNERPFDGTYDVTPTEESLIGSYWKDEWMLCICGGCDNLSHIGEELLILDDHTTTGSAPGGFDPNAPPPSEYCLREYSVTYTNGTSEGIWYGNPEDSDSSVFIAAGNTLSFYNTGYVDWYSYINDEYTICFFESYQKYIKRRDEPIPAWDIPFVYCSN